MSKHLERNILAFHRAIPRPKRIPVLQAASEVPQGSSPNTTCRSSEDGPLCSRRTSSSRLSIDQLRVSDDSPTTSVNDPYSTRDGTDSHPGLRAIGLSLAGLSRISNHGTVPALSRLSYDDSEAYMEREMRQGELLYRLGDDAEELDLSSRTCWMLQQSFAKDVLVWFPLFEQDTCVNYVARATDGGFDRSDPCTCFAFFVLALGRVSKASHHLDDATSDLPGLDYFATGARMIGQISTTTARYSIIIVQSRILMSSVLPKPLEPRHNHRSTGFMLTVILGFIC